MHHTSLIQAPNPSIFTFLPSRGDSMSYHRRTGGLAVALLAGTAAILAAQQPQPGSAAFAPEVGAVAPDFTLPGATRYGLLKQPVKLSEFRGQTVVLAFFPKARTKG
jgi:peroxiredoxin Q/BCP